MDSLKNYNYSCKKASGNAGAFLMPYNLEQLVYDFFKHIRFNRSDFTVNDTFFGSKQPVRPYVAWFIKRAFNEVGIIQCNRIIIFNKLACNLAKDYIVSFQVGQNHCRPFL